MSFLRLKLERSSPLILNAYAMTVAFGTYFCMYAFRKPFTVGVFEGAVDLPGLPPLDYKAVLIIAQVLGYTISKFAGIKLISELAPGKRALAIVLLIGVAELALLGFAVTAAPWNAVFLCLNGFPLGMIWGLVFGFLEGRRTSEALGAGLSASYILASGAVKSAGSWLLAQGISEFWMPFLCGAIFFPVLVTFVYLLQQIPAPSAEDERARQPRAPMDAPARRAFFRQFAPGLVALTAIYMLLTAYRDFRDNFARELWDQMGYGDNPEVFTASELPAALLVLLILAGLITIKNNRFAVTLIHGILLCGVALLGLSTLAFQLGFINAVWWMVLGGVGLYMAYVPFGCLLFDRLMAAVGVAGTAGFMIYVADAFGYLGSVAALLTKSFAHPTLSWVRFFAVFGYVTALVCAVGVTYSLFYFRKQSKERQSAAKTQAAEAQAAAGPTTQITSSQ